MAKKIFSCIACGKRPLSKNEVGINKKLLGIKPQDILDKIEDFKNDGCKLFE